MSKGTIQDPDHIQIFEEARPRLLGLAYRILGSLADAEDAVQDTFVKWAGVKWAGVNSAGTGRVEIDNPAAWLTTACTRRCLDLLRAGHRARTSYVGAWLPEPVHASVENEAEGKLELAQSLTTAFLLMLERLTPKERAAYLLHDVFEQPYAEIAGTLELSEAACRKLVSRAKAHIEKAELRHQTPAAQQDRLLAAFQEAVCGGTTAELAVLLADDIRLSTDSGGKVKALRKVLEGRAAVLAFLGKGLHSFWAGFAWHPAELNGTRGFLITEAGRTVASVTFAYDPAGRARAIYIMRNPDKLARLNVAGEGTAGVGVPAIH
ncbi:sigma-70 family RNA polymerase sigma factor [Pelagibius sp.]|uniref:sigma-70 family RNA polymerase sigma factor n=1 Tax=Pelagibius sp. TaxID=1931238 RepID=UPI0026162F43|nr:sigma-70 family RNA polymerase sigma factor [Pelagibius sp.]